MESFKIDINKLNLKSINELLVKVDEAITILLPIAREAEVKYQLRFDAVLMDGAYSNQALREAHSRSVCEFEGLYRPMIESKGELRSLWGKKELLIEISRNLRALVNNH